jgi:NAD+ kinase
MKTVAIYTLPTKPEAIKYAEEASVLLSRMGVEVIATEDFCEEISTSSSVRVQECDLCDFEKRADVLLSFGGDGTMLAVAKTLLKSGIPIMGFNVGKLGFLAEYNTKHLENSLRDLENGNYRVVERTVLECEVGGNIYYALNDFAMEKKNTSRMITVSAWSNGNHVADYKADGLILTTPTGSTAYSLSCGGPIISPGTPVFCLTPISPHTLTLRPLIIPNSAEVKLRVKSPTGESNFVMDGHKHIAVKDGEEVIIGKSEDKIKLIKPINSSYYDLLREKLLWASEIPYRKSEGDST